MLKLLTTENKKSFSFDSSSVQIQVTRGDQNFISSAVAIADNILLTSAHSVDGLESGRVLLGTSETEIERIIIHPKYNASKSFYAHDIAIVILESNLPSYIMPAVIGENNIAVAGFYKRVGFGLREGINLKRVFDIKYLSKTHDEKNIIFYDTKSVLGDSGGAIYQMTSRGLKLIGIHSTLDGESKLYTVNLSEYTGWINKSISADTLIDSLFHA